MPDQQIRAALEAAKKFTGDEYDAYMYRLSPDPFERIGVACNLVAQLTAAIALCDQPHPDTARLEEIERRLQSRSALPTPMFYADVESGNWTGATGIRFEPDGSFVIIGIGDKLARYRLRDAIDAATSGGGK